MHSETVEQQLLVRVEGAIVNALMTIMSSVRRIAGVPALWLERIETRERLSAMPEWLLADIGLDRSAVAREVRRPFWRPFGACLATSAASFRSAAPRAAPVPLPAVLRPVARFAGATFPTLS